MAKGSLRITKVDSTTAKRLSGAQFELRNQENKVIQKGSTNNKGILLFQGLVVGEYLLVEVQAPKKYEQNRSKYSIVIKANETTEIKIENTLSPIAQHSLYERLLLVFGALWATEDETQLEVGDILNYLSDKVRRHVESQVLRLGEHNQLSLNRAKQKPSRKEIQRLRKQIKRRRKQSRKEHASGIDNSNRDQQLEDLERQFPETYLDILMDEIELDVIESFHEQEKLAEEHLENIVEEAFDQISGELNVSASYTEKEIQDIVEAEWSGARFSDTLWKNKEQLMFNLKRIITQGLIRGDGIEEMTKALQKEMNAAKYASERVIRTETAYVMNQSTLRAYKKSGFKQYEFTAHIDERTSDRCKKKDGKVYRIEEAKVGVNVPPLHPNCRSAILPVIH
ncbi:minor capsid protein [Priestia filamentosa]|uniref:minor capsid protein n=1 Tax=Priestia filamentosa TaxID=1402861 RepID=UPI002E1EDB6D|nr:minor capsid protein [Priestia filamentosa]MED3728534.1 minor capsid protein [Priestia filamentosa]